jgi:hypothetical protein
MPIERRPSHTPPRRAAQHTYFVGRRLFDAVEVYAVTATDVQRLRSRRRYGERVLDSHVLLSGVAELRSSRDLDERFALYVLAHLPDEGFVLDSGDVFRWLRLASEPQDFAPADPARRSLRGRVRTLFRSTAVPDARA